MHYMEVVGTPTRDQFDTLLQRDDGLSAAISTVERTVDIFEQMELITADLPSPSCCRRYRVAFFSSACGLVAVGGYALGTYLTLPGKLYAILGVSSPPKESALLNITLPNVPFGANFSESTICNVIIEFTAASHISAHLMTWAMEFVGFKKPVLNFKEFSMLARAYYHLYKNRPDITEESVVSLNGEIYNAQTIELNLRLAKKCLGEELKVHGRNFSCVFFMLLLAGVVYSIWFMAESRVAKAKIGYEHPTGSSSNEDSRKVGDPFDPIVEQMQVQVLQSLAEGIFTGFVTPGAALLCKVPGILKNIYEQWRQPDQGPLELDDV